MYKYVLGCRETNVNLVGSAHTSRMYLKVITVFLWEKFPFIHHFTLNRVFLEHNQTYIEDPLYRFFMQLKMEIFSSKLFDKLMNNVWCNFAHPMCFECEL